jgi:cation:H+ antiporter
VLPLAGRFAGFASLLALLMTALFLIGLLERRNRTVLRMGMDSLLAIVAYLGGVWVLHGLSQS